MSVQRFLGGALSLRTRRLRSLPLLASLILASTVPACLAPAPRVIKLLPMPQLSTLPAEMWDSQATRPARAPDADFELPPLPATAPEEDMEFDLPPLPASGSEADGMRLPPPASAPG